MKSLFTKILILLIVFAAVFGGYYYVNKDKSEDSDTTMGQAKLPVVSTIVEGVESNLMYGYTTQMEAVYMRDTLTIIPKDHELNLDIYRYNAGVLSIGFEVRSLDTKRLVEDTQIDEWNADGEKIDATLNINNMIDKDTEYLLIIKLSTEDFGEIYYYTRIIDTSENHYKEQTNFVKDFNTKIFDKDQAESIVSYLEPKSSEDNSNLGEANINSSFSQITWGDLAPEKVTQPIISCKELMGDVGNYELKYVIKAKNDYDEYQYYNVTEDYRVKWTSTTMYLLDYNRMVNQIFEANNQNISGSRINVGIDSSLTIDMMASESNNYVAFTKERALWMMDTKENDITRVFAFDEDNEDDLRDINDNHDIEIVSIDDDGNLKFIVYGYMNRGEHEGRVGVALYSYNVTDNKCSEILFIPFTRTYEILKESIGKLSYVSEDTMYIMINDCIYSIDLKGNEYVQIIANLSDDMYCVNDAGDLIAWQENGGSAGGTRIKVLSLETGKEYQVKVGSKYRIKVLGFVDNDFVYGVASKSNITTDKNGYVTFLMSKLKVVSSENKVLKEYSKQGMYFTAAEIKYNMINLKQVKYGEDGNLTQAEDYQIFGNVEEETDGVSVDTIVTELKKTEMVIKFVYKITTSSKLKVIYPNEVAFDNTNAMSIRELATSEGLYYVYSYGRVYGVYTKEADAITKANSVSGVVIDENGAYLWKRISRPTEYLLSGVNVKAAASESGYMAACLDGMLTYNGVTKNVASLLKKGKSSIQIINSGLKNRGLDLSGCDLPQVLYYVCNGQPVLGMINDTDCVLIVGYDFYNAVMINPATGETYKKGIEETEKMFKNAGNRFLGIK